MTNQEQDFLDNGTIIKDSNGKQFLFLNWINPKEMFHQDFMKLSDKKALIVDYDTVENKFEASMNKYELVYE
jgi:hypothetical protein